MEIGVNSFGFAGGRRFILLSPAPPLLRRFPQRQPNGRLSLGTRAWQQEHCPIRRQMCSALVGGVEGSSPLPPETRWPAHFASGCISAGGYVRASGPGLVPASPGKAGLSPPEPWPAPWGAAHPGKTGFREKKRRLFPVLSRTYEYHQSF